MRGHNVNIYFSEKNYNKIKPLIEQRKVSEFVNKLVERALKKEEKREKEELRKKMIEGYKKRAKNEKLKKMLQIYGKMSWEDISNELVSREKKDAK